MRFIVLNRENIQIFMRTVQGVCGKTDVGFRKTISPEFESKMSPAVEL